MFLFLMHWIQGIFSFLINPVTDELRIGLSFASALILTLVLGKKLIVILKRYKVGDRVERDYCETLESLHRDKNHTPTMGGLLIAAVLLFSLLFWGKWNVLVNWILVFVVLSSSLLGFCDDFLKLKRKNTKGIPPKNKLIAQILIASCVAIFTLFTTSSNMVENTSKSEMVEKDVKMASYLYVPFRKDTLNFYGYFGLAIVFLFIVFVMVGSSNAVNLTDGLDGLASGTSIMVVGFFLFVAWITGNPKLSEIFRVIHISDASEIAIFLASFLGSCLGFLFYNRYPAQIFMGDTGSLMLGNAIGAVAIFLRRELFLAIVGGVFVVEALSVIIQVYSCKLRGGKRVFLCSPLHHHFEYLGWSERKVVVRFWIIGMLLSFLGLISIFKVLYE